MKTISLELCAFLVKAKKATYASEGEANERVLEDGCKELSFKQGDFSYRDRYFGFNPFVGEEIVWKNSKVVWCMNYYGRIVSTDVSEKQIYTFLQSALRQVKENRPFRGPQDFKNGDFEYFDDSKGDITDFTGKERILFRGKEVYVLIYHGCTM